VCGDEDSRREDGVEIISRGWGGNASSSPYHSLVKMLSYDEKILSITPSQVLITWISGYVQTDSQYYNQPLGSTQPSIRL